MQISFIYPYSYCADDFKLLDILYVVARDGTCTRTWYRYLADICVHQTSDYLVLVPYIFDLFHV